MVVEESEAGGGGGGGLCVCVCSRDLGQGKCNWGAQREEHNMTMHEKWDMSSRCAERYNLK